jgi:uncharacterized membrane protein
MKVPRAATAAIAFSACLAALAIAYAIKTNCAPQDSGTYPGICYTDITAIYRSRGLDTGTIPYVDFPAGGSYNDPGFLEYPVITGAVVALTAIPSSSPGSYLAWNAVVLGAVALVSTLLLVRIAGPSTLRWAAAPALVLFAFSNWDLLAVGCVIAGCAMTVAGRHSWAAFWFGVGAAAKLFPAVFILPLLLDRMRRGDKAGALKVGLAAGGALIVPNALLAVLTDGWWVTYAFHSQRGADLGSIWAWLLPHTAPISMVNLATTVPLALAGLAILAAGWTRRQDDGSYPVLQVGSCLLALMLLTSKIASPQQALWLLPSFVLVSTQRTWWLAWNGWAILVFAVSFGVGIGPYDASMASVGVGLGALVRALLLFALVFVFWRAGPVARTATTDRA